MPSPAPNWQPPILGPQSAGRCRGAGNELATSDEWMQRIWILCRGGSWHKSSMTATSPPFGPETRNEGADGRAGSTVQKGRQSTCWPQNTTDNCNPLLWLCTDAGAGTGSGATRDGGAYPCSLAWPVSELLKINSNRFRTFWQHLLAAFAWPWY